MLRKAAVAGRFYPASSESLRSEVAHHLSTQSPKLRARGIVVPHAGYMYSGHVAGAVYSCIEVPRRIIILCPNHTGLGAPLSIMSQGEWEIPLGVVKIDSELAQRLARHCHLLTEDSRAHRSEHSLEVQLPFLYYLQTDVRFVPIAVGSNGYATLERLGKGIGAALRETSDEVLVIASSDMNHYEPDDLTRTKDKKAIDKILDLDPRGLYDVIRAESISMCGYGPTVAMLNALEGVQNRKAELVRYATSGDVSGDKQSVVGYAGIVIHEV